jgi:hypothetical protein
VFGTDARSDLYSLGATLYHLVTGQTPIDALTRAAAVVEGRSDPLRAVNEVNRMIAFGVGSALHKAMQLSRNQRHDSAAEMRRAIHADAEVVVSVPNEETEVIGAPRKPVLPLHRDSPDAELIADPSAKPPEAQNESARRQLGTAESVKKTLSLGETIARQTIPPAERSQRLDPFAFRESPVLISWPTVLIVGGIILFIVILLVGVVKQFNWGPSDIQATSVGERNAASPASRQPAEQSSAAASQVLAGQPLTVTLEAATGDVWIKYQVDDAKPTTLVLKQGQVQDLPPAQKPTLLSTTATV